MFQSKHGGSGALREIHQRWPTRGWQITSRPDGNSQGTGQQDTPCDKPKPHICISFRIRSAAGPPEEKLKKLRSSRDLAPIKNLPKKTSKISKRKMKMKSSATVAKAPATEAAVLAAHIAPPRRAAAATAQAISEAQQVCLFRGMTFHQNDF